VRIDHLNWKLVIRGDMRPGTLLPDPMIAVKKAAGRKPRHQKKHGPCCEISFIGKAKGISKFVREEDLPAFCD
jgi:hypothetical protein